MSNTLRILAALTVVLALAGSAWADLPGGRASKPLPVKPSHAVSIRLEVGADETGAVLYLPKRLLGKAKLTDQGKNAHAAVAPANLVGGVGLALALTVSGLGLFPILKRPGAKGRALILALAAVLIAGRCSLQAQPPAPHTELPQLTLSGGKVRVVVMDEGDAVRLVVPKAQLADWAARLKAPEKNAP